MAATYNCMYVCMYIYLKYDILRFSLTSNFKWFECLVYDLQFSINMYEQHRFTHLVYTYLSLVWTIDT